MLTDRIMALLLRLFILWLNFLSLSKLHKLNNTNRRTKVRIIKIKMIYEIMCNTFILFQS